MQSYELTCLFHPEGQLHEQNLASLRELFTRHAIHSTEREVGLKTLAYPIKKITSAYYWTFNFDASNDFLQVLREFFLYNEGILRHLLVVAEKPKKAKKEHKPKVNKAEEHHERS